MNKKRAHTKHHVTMLNDEVIIWFIDKALLTVNG